MTYRNSWMGFLRNPLLTPKIQVGCNLPFWKSTWRHFFCWGWSNLDKILQTGAEWHADCGDMVKTENRSRISIWRTFGEFCGMSSQCCLPHCRVAATRRIQWHVILEPCITLQGAATWWIHCHDFRATCHIAGHCYLAKSMSWSWYIAGCNNSICHIENCFPPYFFKCSLGFDERRLLYHLRYTCFMYMLCQKLAC